MRIKVICVGKLKEKYLRDAAAEYIKRVRPFGKIEVIEVPDEKDDRPDVLETEAERILKQLRGNEYVVTLEIKGGMLSSEKLAEKISRLGVSGVSDMAFIIGGSTGLHDSVSARADLKLSFSRMTFPHQLARIMLLEQIYRAYKINQGGRYHK